MKPVFLFSMPRSGSTLIQRVLSSHKEIATVSEPWLLLPLIYSLKQDGSYTEFNHRVMTNAISELINELPNGRSDYYEQINKFAIGIYTGLIKNNEKY